MTDAAPPTAVRPSPGRRHPLRATRRVAVAGAAVALVVSGGVAAAATIARTTDTTIHGCENTRTGALSVRRGPSCPSGTRGLPWDTTGPRGPAGAPGRTGAAGPSGTLFSRPGSAGFDSADGVTTLADLPLAAGGRYLLSLTANATSQVDANLLLRCDFVTTTDGTVDGNGTDTDTYVDLPQEQTVDVAMVGTVAVGTEASSVTLSCEQVTPDNSDTEAVEMGSIEVTATAVGSLREVS